MCDSALWGWGWGGRWQSFYKLGQCMKKGKYRSTVAQMVERKTRIRTERSQVRIPPFLDPMRLASKSSVVYHQI